MGNQLNSQLISQDIPTYLFDVQDFVYQQTIGNGKILKTLQCLHEEGVVVIKLYIKKERVKQTQTIDILIK
jgi:hypothetical protein